MLLSHVGVTDLQVGCQVDFVIAWLPLDRWLGILLLGGAFPHAVHAEYLFILFPVWTLEFYLTS